MLNKQIKIFITDVDGVLTDGKIYYSSNGDVLRRYDMHDGIFFKVKEKGILTAFCSGESDDSIKNRAQKLGIDFLIMGSKDKLKDISDLLQKEKISFDELAYVGDDLNDISIMEKAGLSVAVKNAVLSVKKIADYTTKHEGGNGAIREVIEKYFL